MHVLWHGLGPSLSLAQHLPGGTGIIVGLPLRQGLIAAAASVVWIARLCKVGPRGREREREGGSERERSGDKMINGEVLPVDLHVHGQTGLWCCVTEKAEDLIT